MKEKTFKNMRLFALLLLPALLIAAVLFATTKPVMTAGATSISPPLTSIVSTVPLSEMADTDRIDFIVQSGIEIPDDLIDSPDFNSAVLEIIQASHRSKFSYTLTQDLADNIQ
jgi:hypothetical protein